MSEPIRTIPSFGSESEEADWWASNPEFVLQELKRAKAEVRLGQGTVARRLKEAAAGTAKSTTIRLDPADISLAKLQAANRGLKYQTYLKMLIHEALRRDAH